MTGISRNMGTASGSWLRRTLLGGAVALSALIAAVPSPAAQIQACFSPPLAGSCDPLMTVLRAINDARATIRVQMYTLTLHEVVSALVKAKQRGVDVRVIVDRSQLHQDRNDSFQVEALASA